jgi:uncharacterized membrane protein
MLNFVSVFSLFIIFSFQLFSQSTPEFIDLGPGGASKVSRNGVYVCGSNYPAPAFLWSQASGRINLGSTYTEAYSVADNGMVVGRYLDSSLISPSGNPTYRAGYYINNQWDSLPGYPGYPVLDEMSYTHAYGISQDGSMIVGMQWTPNWRAEACYWDISGINLLGRTGNQSSRANAVVTTGSGFIIAGWDGLQSGPDRRAFYWDPAPHFMGGYDTTYPVGECRGMSSDGSMIVGGSAGAPFIWTQATGMQWITEDYINYASYATDISDDGVVVGYVSLGVGNFNAFIKKPEWNDIVFLKNYMIDSLGISGISDWYFPFANSISADGLTIVGTAYPLGAGPNAYVVKLPNIVPVELTSFTATYFGNIVELNWSTATETNNQGFSVERKTGNSDWNQIGFVSGRGTTTEPNFYSYTDNLVSVSKYYYRLKQQDFDGSVTYSNEIEVDVNPVSEFSLNQNYPNPFNPSTTFEFIIPETALVDLSMYNMLGEKVATLVNDVLEEGNHKVEFNAAHLSSGVYLVKMSAGTFSKVIKINLLK